MIIKKKRLFLGEKIRSAIKQILSLLIISILFVAFSPEAQTAQRKESSNYKSKVRITKKKRYHHRRRHHIRRHYNPSLTRAKALEMIRRHSEAVCEIAGLEPIIGDSTVIYDDPNDSEDVDEITEDSNSTYTDSEDKANSSGESAASEDDIKDTAIDMNTFRMLWLSYVDDGKTDQNTAGGINKKELMNVILEWLGTPYRFGGMTHRAIDCSAFTQSVFAEACGLQLPRTARYQVEIGTPVKREDLEFGDLIFFHTYSYRFASHVGIYLGDNLFAHASSRYGVTVSSLNAHYYTQHFICGRRLYLNDLDQYVSKAEFKRSSE